MQGRGRPGGLGAGGLGVAFFATGPVWVLCLGLTLKSLKIGQSQILSDPFVKLSNVGEKPPDILSDTSEIEVNSLSDPHVLVSDPTVTLSDVNVPWSRTRGFCVKWRTSVMYLYSILWYEKGTGKCCL